MLVKRNFKLFRWQPTVNPGHFLWHRQIHLSNDLQSKKKNFNATRKIKQLIGDDNCRNKDDLIRNVFAVYDSLGQNQDCILINKLLSFCSTQINHPMIRAKIMDVSDHINSQQQQIDAATMGLMMKCLINSNCCEKAMSLYEHFELFDEIHDNITTSLYLKACTKTKSFEKGQKFIAANLKRLNKQSLQVLHSMIDFYGSSGDINAALDIFNSIDRNQKNIFFIASMMSACINCSEFDEAREVYKQYEGKHNDFSHRLYLKACSTSNKTDIFFKDLDRHSIRLFEYYCSKQSGYSNDDMFKICRKKRIDPIKYILSILLGRCIATKEFDKFDILFNEIMQNIPKYADDVIFCCILDGIIKNGRSEFFESVWNKVTKHGITPNTDCYRLALLALSNRKNAI